MIRGNRPSISFSILDTIFCVYIAFAMLPISSIYIPPIIMLAVLGVGLIFLVKYKGIVERIVWLLLYLVLYIFVYSNTANNMAIRLYQGLLYIFPIIVGISLVYTGNYKKIKKMAVVALILMLVTMFTSLIVLESDPMAARILATNLSSDSEQLLRYTRQNVGGYELVYSTVIAFPLIIGLYKTKKINVVLFAVLSVFELNYLLYSQYTYALFIFLLEVVIVFIPKRVSVGKIVIIELVAGVCLLYFFRPLLISGLQSLIELINFEAIQMRLEEIISVLEGKSIESTNDFSIRIERYRTAFYYITHYPVIGSAIFGIKSASGHSTILDMISTTGIVGVGCIVGWWYTLKRFIARPLKNMVGIKYYSFSLLVFFVVGLLNNITGTIMFCTIGIIGPGCLMIYNDK